MVQASSATASESDRPATATFVVTVDPIEAALASALERASVAGEWSTVAQLARELETRRNARAATNVVPISRARGK